MSTRVRSFSGTHSFREQCAANAVILDWYTDEMFSEEGGQQRLRQLGAKHAERIADSVARGICPRCMGPMERNYPAGSRVTSCRCIPVCWDCGRDEAQQPLIGLPVSAPWSWPTSKSARAKRFNKLTRLYGDPVLGSMAGDTVISEVGVTTVGLKPSTGGWAEYGHDEEGGLSHGC